MHCAAGEVFKNVEMMKYLKLTVIGLLDEVSDLLTNGACCNVPSQYQISRADFPQF